MRGSRKVVPVSHKQWKILHLENEKEETTTKHCFQCGKELKEYCEMTTLHGYKYLVERRRSLIERIYWIVAFILVYAGVSYSIYDQLWLYIRKPVLMSLDSYPTHVWDLPFPAITICSENRIRPSTFDYTGILMKRNYSEKEKNFLQYAAVICITDLGNDGLEYIDTKYLDEIMEKGFAACNSTFLGIRWLKNETTRNVCDMLQRRITPVGTCHTFNSMAFKYMFKETMFHGPQYQLESNKEAGDLMWTPDGGYITEADVIHPPWRASGGGIWQGAIFLLNLDIHDLDETCTFDGHGFTVAVHNPVETETSSLTSVFAKTDHITEISVMPKQQLTSAELLYWSAEKRGCYHESERQLQFFQYYTRRNCDLECETNITLAACGCVAFYQPRLESTPVCGFKKLDCLIDSMVHTPEKFKEVDDNNICECLPSCSELEYEVDVNSVPRNFSMSNGKTLQEYLGSQLYQNNIAFIRVHFRSRKITATERVAVFGLTDFIANVGGLMGLFLGFSFLSLFEIFYFIFLRYNAHCKSDTNQQTRSNKQQQQQPHQVLSPWSVLIQNNFRI